MSKRRRQATANQAITTSGASAIPDTALVPSPPESNAAEALQAAVEVGSPSGMSIETYAQERTTLIEIEQKSADQHDKAILTISMGGLALSITFLKDIAPHPLPGTLWSIGVSWSLFVASMLTILASFLTSQTACRLRRDLLDELFQSGTRETENKADWWSSVTKWLNSVSYTLVFFAVIFFALFSWLNLK
jgi:hypothetical protein